MEENDPKTRNSHTNEHLANERTFLAWIRTGLGLIAFGFVLERFSILASRLQHLLAGRTVAFQTPPDIKTTVFGVFLICCGILLSIFAFFKYLNVSKQIDEDTYTPTYTLEAFATLLLILCGVFLFFFLIF